MIGTPMENSLDNLLAHGSLLPIFVSPDTIIKLELPKETNFPYY
jgi:hypothetical protein